MQPEPNETSKKDSFDSIQPFASKSTHHGLPQHIQQASSRLYADEMGRQPRSPSTSRSASDTSSEGSDNSSERSLRRLNGLRRHTGSPVNRILEYEGALTRSTRKRRGGPAFTVVQRNRPIDALGVGLSDFPNEVLTHILSHLPPPSLSDVALVSKSFHQLVTTPHAWRSAFTRFFPGPEAMSTRDANSEVSENSDTLHSERRFFTRLTPFASWRSEYILRTRLLRSLARGKPAELSALSSSSGPRSNAGNSASAHNTYNSNLVSTVTHLHTNFGSGLGNKKKAPRLIHGTNDLGTASLSDPLLGKIDNWGFQDSANFRQFADLFPGDAEYGLGPGDCVGVPNVMDVSQPLGMIYGEGHQHESILWYRHIEEKRGRALLRSTLLRKPKNGIPQLTEDEAICSVWIAKSSKVPELSDGLLGMLAGTSSGVLTAYSAGTNGLRDRRLERGEITARWVLSPGVPIIGIHVDGNLSLQRMASRRIVAVVLNALGEVFYLRDIPVSSTQDILHGLDRSTHQAQSLLEELAWDVGRTVYWALLESTRRRARADPFDMLEVDGSYSPRTSWVGVHLSSEQLAAETKEIESFLQKKPECLRKVCHGWDMRRRLEVDFAACDDHGAGEGIVVICCGLDEGSVAEMKRYTHRSLKESTPETISGSRHPRDSSNDRAANAAKAPGSLFGDRQITTQLSPSWSFANVAPVHSGFVTQNEEGVKETLVEEWRTSVFTFGASRLLQITSSAVDESRHALLTASEDPLLSVSNASSVSSPKSSLLGSMVKKGSSSDIPGYRALLMAVGTKTGTIILFDMRSPTASNTIIENAVNPIRVIHTDSPQISCLALTALYLVHGGNDGLVQAWDPLASTRGPIRTLNSRFSSRARRRLVQAEASPAGVGVNLFAAGAICLDPDPTVLRGIVSLGSHLRYWSYSSITADEYKVNKRRLRRSDRGSNPGGDRFSGTGRGALMDYIANEKLELEREKKNKCEEEKRLAGRFGVDLLGPGTSEDEILAYATMLSEEAAESDEIRRKSASEASSGDTVTEEAVVSPPVSDDHEEPDEDIVEAIRLSLQQGSKADASSSNISIKHAERTTALSPRGFEPSVTDAADPDDEDLEYVLQLSLAEEESKAESGKGKGRQF